MVKLKKKLIFFIFLLLTASSVQSAQQQILSTDYFDYGNYLVKEETGTISGFTDAGEYQLEFYYEGYSGGIGGFLNQYYPLGGVAFMVSSWGGCGNGAYLKKVYEMGFDKSQGTLIVADFSGRLNHYGSHTSNSGLQPITYYPSSGRYVGGYKFVIGIPAECPEGNGGFYYHVDLLGIENDRWTHLECVNSRCQEVDGYASWGCGTINGVPNDNDCGHSECQNEQCVWVDGWGNNACEEGNNLMCSGDTKKVTVRVTNNGDSPLEFTLMETTPSNIFNYFSGYLKTAQAGETVEFVSSDIPVGDLTFPISVTVRGEDKSTEENYRIKTEVYTAQ